MSAANIADRAVLTSRARVTRARAVDLPFLGFAKSNSDLLFTLRLLKILGVGYMQRLRMSSLRTRSERQGCLCRSCLKFASEASVF